jgi:hypothetical protein
MQYNSEKRQGQMNKIPAVFTVLCATALLPAAQTRLLVAKSRTPVAVVGDHRGGIGLTYAVVDATTGRQLAAYEADQEAKGPIACYAPDPDRFFIFSDTRGLDLVEAEPK